jgi:hypothetical protein
MIGVVATSRLVKSPSNLLETALPREYDALIVTRPAAIGTQRPASGRAPKNQ